MVKIYFLIFENLPPEISKFFSMKIKKNIALSDTGFVFNPGNGDSFSVNPIGLEILKILNTPRLVVWSA